MHIYIYTHLQAPHSICIYLLRVMLTDHTLYCSLAARFNLGEATDSIGAIRKFHKLRRKYLDQVSVTSSARALLKTRNT